jgi:hypothetical protein
MAGLKANVHDHVLSDRLGEEEFRVLSMDDQHYDVVGVQSGKRHQIYKALCRTTPAIMMANRARRVMRAEKIGRKTG